MNQLSDPRAPPGVNVVGYLRAEVGVGEAARLVVAALKAAGVPFAVVPYPHPTSRHEREFADGNTAEPIYDTNIICVNADQLPRFIQDLGRNLVESRYTIGLWMWEVEKFPEEMTHSAALIDEIWVASNHAASAVAPVVAKPVVVFPLPVLRTEPLSVPRSRLGLPGGFLFLFCFDFHSVFERKNPIALIDAFVRAFPAATGDVALVIKSINGNAHREDLERLRDRAAGRDDIVVIDKYLAAAQQQSLMDACDAYVSLHRAEGFGLTIAEAMILGKPVIATAYSGNLEFMNGRNSYLVPYELVPIAPGTDPYPAGARWAEPNVAAAAALMRQVFHDREGARQVAERGLADITRLHSTHARAPFLRRRFLNSRLPTVRHSRSLWEARLASTGGAAVAGPTPASVSDPPGATLSRRSYVRALQRVLMRLLRPLRQELAALVDWSDRITRYVDARLSGSAEMTSEEARRLSERLGTLEIELSQLSREIEDLRASPQVSSAVSARPEATALRESAQR